MAEREWEEGDKGGGREGRGLVREGWEWGRRERQDGRKEGEPPNLFLPIRS